MYRLDLSKAFVVGDGCRDVGLMVWCRLAFSFRLCCVFCLTKNRLIGKAV